MQVPLWRHARASVLPVGVTGVIPSLLLKFAPVSLLPANLTFQPLGLPTYLLGLTLLVATNVNFHKANGTLAPFDPPSIFPSILFCFVLIFSFFFFVLIIYRIVCGQRIIPLLQEPDDLWNFLDAPR